MKATLVLTVSTDGVIAIQRVTRNRAGHNTHVYEHVLNLGKANGRLLRQITALSSHRGYHPVGLWQTSPRDGMRWRPVVKLDWADAMTNLDEETDR